MLGNSFMNPGQPNGNDPTSSNNDLGSNQDSDPGNPSPAGPPAPPGPTPSPAGPKNLGGTITISGNYPSGQPTGITAAPVRVCGIGVFTCPPPPAHQVFDKDLSGQVGIPGETPMNRCEDPFNPLPKVEIWEKRAGESDFVLSQNTQDHVTVDPQGFFSHHLHFETNNWLCDRSIKFKISFAWKGDNYSAESEEYDCHHLPLTQAGSGPIYCPLPPSEDPGDDYPWNRPGRHGRYGDDEDQVPPWKTGVWNP